MATGKRLQVNFRNGTLSAAMADGTVTSADSAEFADLPTITAGSNTYLALTIENEILHVTAHAAGATTVTVERGQEGTAGTGHALGVAWEHAPTARDFAEPLESLLAANSGTAYAIDMEVPAHRVTLTGNVTFAFSGPVANYATSVTVILVQDATGGWTVTWPAAVKWAGGTAPTLTTAANAVDVLTFVTTDGGTTIYGFLAGKDVK